MTWRSRGLVSLAALLALGSGVWAEAPQSSLFPAPRPTGEVAAPVSVDDAPVAGATAPTPPPLPPVEPAVPPGIAALTEALTPTGAATDPSATASVEPPQARPGAASEAPDTPDASVATAAASDLAPPVSLVPVLRPGAVPRPMPPAVADTSDPAIENTLAEVLRPEVLGPVGGGSALAIARSLRPELRPGGLEQRVRAEATRTTPSRVAQPGQPGGSLCGIPGLQGEEIQAITGGSSGCGIAEPIRLRSVDGVRLSQPATINCTAATALRRWLQTSAIPTVGRTGGGITSLRVVASYACRTRNSQRGARLSEHARGNAIDIAGIGLANGQELTVLSGWRDRRVGPLLQQMHRGACGPFGTVLGPNSDRFHRDHFHFDVASYRSGPYCR